MSDEKELIIVRGSTPLLSVTLPEDLKTSDIASGIISISQRNKGVLISKSLEEMVVDGNKYSVFLKQSETLKLDSTKPAAIQAKFCTIDDIVLISFIQNIEILPVNNEKLFAQDNPSGDTYEATGESGIEIVPDLVDFTPDMDVEQVVINTDDYTQLRNKPVLNGVTIIGNQTSDEFGIYNSEQVDALLEPIVEKDTEQDERISTLERASDEHGTAIGAIGAAVGALHDDVETLDERVDSQLGEFTVGRNVAADEYTNAQIDGKVQAVQDDVDALDSSAVKSVNTITPVNGNVTLGKGDVGLGNVTNDAQVKRTEMGVAEGVATLDSSGKVPSAQLPSYVDDVEEYASVSQFPATGEAGKIYVATDTNTTYRWSGSQYIIIGNPVVVDPTPVQGSTNAVSSGGVYTALGGKQDKLTFDNTPTAGSTNPVTSDGIASVVSALNSNLNQKANTSDVADALAQKQNKLTFDDTPTEDSENPVTSGGLYSLLEPVASEATGQSILTTETAMNTTMDTLLTRLVDAHLTTEAGDLIVQDLMQGNILLAQLARNIEESGVF